MEIKLSSQQVLEKEFKKKKIGPAYDEDNVNDFLNIIIEDYENFEKCIEEYKAQVEELRRENYKLRATNIKADVSLNDHNSYASSKRSVEDRLSSLEANIDLVLQKIK